MIESRHAFVRVAGGSLMAAAALAVVGYFSTIAIGGTSAAPAMALGILAALIGGWMSVVVWVLALHRPPQILAAAAIGGLVVRFAATLSLALFLRAWEVCPVRPMLLWVAIAQFVILMADTIGLIRVVRVTGRAAEAA